MRPFLLLISLCALLLSGCGNDDNDTAGSPAEPGMTVETTPTAMDEQADSEAADVATQQTSEAESDAGAEAAAAMAETDAAVAAAEPAAAEPKMSGEQVFKKYCFACHMTGAANAPKVGDVAAWEPRIAKGMDALLMSAMQGVPNTAMMPSGGCNSCSEEELMAAIEFMVNQSR